MTEGTATVDQRRRGSLTITLGVALGWLVLDQLSKLWAVHALADGHVVSLGLLDLRLTYNSGMAFSQGRGLGPVIGVVALVVVAVLVLSVRRGGSVLGAVAVGLIVGGAAGNVLDRLVRSDSGFLQGHVVDFIDFRWWPVFNVADMGVVVGGALLLLSSLRDDRPRG